MARTAAQRRVIVARKILSLTLGALGVSGLTWSFYTALNYGTDPLGNELIPVAEPFSVTKSAP